MTKRAFYATFPESDDPFAIYTALQEAGMPCFVARSPVDPGMVRIEISFADNRQTEHAERVQAFVAGWVACYNREELPPTDKPLNVSRPSKYRKCLDEKACKDV